MPWNGSGTFNRTYSWVADKLASINITASRMDTDTNDIVANGLGNSLTRDGQGQPTANLPMANFRHTGVGSGVNRTDYGSLGQVQDGTTNWVAVGGTADALTATFSPALTALKDGQLVHIRMTATNITTTPTFNPSGLGAATIVGNFRGTLPGDLVAGAEAILRYNLANTNWVHVNQPDVPVGGVVPYFGGTPPASFILPQGQNFSAATYPAANAILGTTYGNPGGGNFTAPDLRGRVVAGLDAGGSGRITVAGGNFDGTTLGTAGGAQNKSVTVAQANLPNVSFTNSGITTADSGHTHNGAQATTQNATIGSGASNTGWSGPPGSSTSAAAVVSITAQGSAASGGSGTALLPAIVQPTMVINLMMRIA